MIAPQCRHEVINGKTQLSHGVLFDLSISDDNFRAAANYTPQTAALEGKPRNDDFKANHRQNGQNTGQQGNGINYDVVLEICKNIKTAVQTLGVQMGIVVGGGNFWRGRSSGKMDRTRADHMGMLATVINALALADALESLDVPVRVQTAITMEQFAEPYIRNRAVRHMEKDRVVIFGCGTGNPFFSTDTAAALRAAEIDADAILKATMVDGVYDKDPKKYPDAKRYSTVSFSQVLAQNLNVMDMTAASLCRESKIPIVVFDLSDPENICRALCGYDIGTIVKEA